MFSQKKSGAGYKIKQNNDIKDTYFSPIWGSKVVIINKPY